MALQVLRSAIPFQISQNAKVIGWEGVIRLLIENGVGFCVPMPIDQNGIETGKPDSIEVTS